MSERHWLWRLTYPGSPHPLGHQPYLFEHDGEIWSAVTNGRVVVFLSGQVGDFDQATPALVEILLRFFSPVGKRTGFYLDELKQFLGPAVWSVQCPECAGASTTCPRCKGKGELAPAIRPGWLCGVTIDRNLLAMALERLAADIVWLYTQERGQPLFVIAESWRVALMTLVSRGRGIAPKEGQVAIKGDEPGWGAKTPFQKM
jgi:hypothetical protein